MQIDDETLMALSDGELDPARADELRRVIAADPALQARLRQFEETRRLLSGLRGQPTGEEDPLAATIRAAATDAPPPPVLPQAANLNRRPWLAVAASAAVVALGLGWWQWSGRAPSGLAEAELAALDSLPSGEVVALSDGSRLAMIASFRDGAGALCREYETLGADSARIVLACRDEDGWQQRFAATGAVEGDHYSPASGADPVEAALDAIGAGAPLTPEEEAAALQP